MNRNRKRKTGLSTKHGNFLFVFVDKMFENMVGHKNRLGRLSDRDVNFWWSRVKP